MINRRGLINKLGGTALVVGAAAAVTSKPALAYDHDDDDWQHVRDEDRDYRCEFEHFDDCEDKVIKIVEIIKVKIVHFKRKDGYHKYHIYDDSWASCNDNHDGYWVETPKYDYEVVRYPKDNH